jgi:ribosomal protein L19
MLNKTKIIGYNRKLQDLYFKVGDILQINYESKQGYWSIKNFIGRCISKKNKGVNTKVILRNVIDNVCVEYDFFLYGSDIVGVTKLDGKRNIPLNKGKLYYLRRHNLNKSKV